MKTQKQFQVKVRKPKDNCFGDFIITNLDLNKNKGVIDFGNGAVAEADVSAIADKLASYSSRNKTYYVRMV